MAMINDIFHLGRPLEVFFLVLVMSVYTEI